MWSEVIVATQGGRRYRINLKDGEPMGVDVLISSPNFDPHSRRIWSKGDPCGAAAGHALQAWRSAR